MINEIPSLLIKNYLLIILGLQVPYQILEYYQFSLLTLIFKAFIAILLFISNLSNETSSLRIFLLSRKFSLFGALSISLILWLFNQRSDSVIFGILIFALNFTTKPYISNNLHSHANNKSFDSTYVQTDPFKPGGGASRQVTHLRRKSLSGVLDDDEKWLDLLDQGYFLCNKDLALLYKNKKAHGLMTDVQQKFEEFIEKLVELQEPRHSLKEVVLNLIKSGVDGATAKAEFGFIDDSKEDNSLTSFKAGLFCNYRAKIWKLKSNFVLIVMKEKDQFSTLILAEKLSKATNCTLSHELKTLLNGIVGNLDLLEDGISKEHFMFYKIALSSSHILSSRLNDLLDYIQIQDQGFKLHVEEFCLSDLLIEITQTCNWPAKQKRLEFNTFVDESIPEYLVCDRTRIKQILINLLTKAIEYTDFGNITLKIKKKSGVYVNFKVKSEGNGMHYKLLTQLKSFSPKCRKARCTNEVDESPMAATKNMEEMYLEISQLICKQMGTRIIVKSNEKGVSQFSFAIQNAFPNPKEPGQLLSSSASQSSKRRSRHGIGSITSIVEKTEGISTPKLSQFGIEGVVNCGTIENLNIINVNVAENVGIPQNLLSRRSNDNNIDNEIPLEHDIHSIISIRKYSLSPKHMPTRKQKNSQLFTSPDCRRRSEFLRSRSKLNVNVSSNIESITQKTTITPNLKREKLRRCSTQSDTRNRISIVSIHKNNKFTDDSSSRFILIVDDNMSNRFVLKAMLKKHGFNCIEAQDGQDALTVVERYVKSNSTRDILLIFMDLQMPIMNGIESTKEIIGMCVSAGVSVPHIIGVSSDPSEEDRNKFEKAGIDEFVSKPIDKIKMENIIKKYIMKKDH